MYEGFLFWNLSFCWDFLQNVKYDKTSLENTRPTVGLEPSAQIGDLPIKSDH
jgi:hypothetical protein